MTHCENCLFWLNGYCKLHKQETNDGATCDKALDDNILGVKCKCYFLDYIDDIDETNQGVEENED